jgi:hypothetical protein
MRVDAGDTTVVLTDRPIVERAFNAFSAVAGAFVGWLSLRFYEPGGDWADLVLALFAPFLLAFAATGLWRLLTLRTTTCRVDGARRVVELEWQAPFARRDSRWSFDDIAELHVGADAARRVALVLRDGRRITLLPHGGERESVERFVLQARRIMTSA